MPRNRKLRRSDGADGCQELILVSRLALAIAYVIRAAVEIFSADEPPSWWPWH
jgi:hypothetical protein